MVVQRLAAVALLLKGEELEYTKDHKLGPDPMVKMAIAIIGSLNMGRNKQKCC